MPLGWVHGLRRKDVADTVVRFKDFTKKRVPVFFNIEGERFDCAPAVPIDDLQEMVKGFGEVTAENIADALRAFFEKVMDEATAARLSSMMKDKKNPLDMEQAKEIMEWLLEVYSLRPTEPSSESSTGSATDGGGTPSGDGLSVEVPIL